MRNIAVDKYRKNRSAKNIPSELVVSLNEFDESLVGSPSVEEEYEIRQISRILNDFLRNANDRDEFMFVCRYYYADKLSTIAEMIGVSEKTVYRALLKMRNDLKEELKKEGFEK